MEKQTFIESNQKTNPLDVLSEQDLPESEDQIHHLSRKETRQIVTPYAFFVADDLLGTPLAGPFRRGFALLIDLFFVVLLTQVSSLILAAVAALTFFRAGNRLKTKKRFNAARIFLRLLVALLLFIVAMGIVDWVNEGGYSDSNTSEELVISDEAVNGMEIVAITAKYLLDTKSMKQRVVEGQCQPAYNCFKRLGENLVQDIVKLGLDKEAINSALDGYLSIVFEDLNEQQQEMLSSELQQFSESSQAAKVDFSKMDDGPKYTEDENVSKPEIPEQFVDTSDSSGGEKSEAVSKNIIAWFENLADELGIGLGWAAFYFSIFTAWWKGQTPGKKLTRIKVIKLDNQPLNLWESFGRYGGYAAGLATGLSGFLQVFWDPNRQAIQDKISETLVIDLRKPKVPFVKEISEQP
jgi:hypothetical protein